MAVYVDKLLPCLKNLRWPYNQSCHLVADSLTELHAFAKRSALKRAWFQNHPRLPHYDLTASKRQRAIRLGALQIGRTRIVVMMKQQTDAARSSDELAALTAANCTGHFCASANIDTNKIFGEIVR